MSTEVLAQLASRAKLLEIVVFELRAKKNHGVAEEKVPELVQVRPAYNLETASKDDNSGFLITLSIKLDLPAGSIYCEIGAAYDFKEPIDFALSADALVEYSNEVAVMTLLPFLRQNIADISQRVLGFPLLMPIMPRGSLSFTLNEAKPAEG